MSQSEQSARFRDAGNAPGVNLVADDRQVRRQVNCADSIRDLFGLKGRFYFEQTQPNRFRRIALDAVGIDDAPSKHLVASTDSPHPSACATMPHQKILPARAAQPFQIGDGALRPRNDQDVKTWRDAGIAQVVNGDICFALQRFEVRIVRYAREMYHSNRQWLVSSRPRDPS